MSTRHSWSEPETVEVPWSAAPEHVRTCLKCGTKKQRVPIDGEAGRWIYEFTASDGRISRGLTPACEGAA